MLDRPTLDELDLKAGKRTRLRRILRHSGARNGTAMLLPHDQGLEHGPRDFFQNPASSDPRYVLDLAVEGGFNGIVLQVGLAEKFYRGTPVRFRWCSGSTVRRISHRTPRRSPRCT